MKPTGKAKGGHARAKKLSPEQRSAIAKKGAKARWGAPPPKLDPSLVPLRSKGVKSSGKPPAERRNNIMATWRDPLRDEIAAAVLTGLYANIADAQKFANYVMPGMLIPEAFTRMAYTQADEVLRLRAL